jgi:heme/copper-type cytochrome/quinol oxidase subunit 2
MHVRPSPTSGASTRPARPKGRRWLSLAAAVLVLAIAGVSLTAIDQNRHEFTVTARRYTYQVGDSDEPVIRVRLNDFVKIAFSAEDIPHSFTIDEYRIGRRAVPGKDPVTFEFRADRPGTFTIYCNLTGDPRCQREHRGRLIVEEPRTARQPTGDPSRPAR